MSKRVWKNDSGRRGVVVCGAYGMDNAGDDAVLTAIVAQLRRLDRQMPITVMARQPEKTAKRFGVTAVHPLRVFGWLRAMHTAKLFISGGGSLLQDVTSRRSLWYYLETIRLAKRMGCAVQLYGCGVGPLRDERSRASVADTLNRCADAVTLRDEDSLALLRTLGVTTPRLLLAADPALRLDSPVGERERRMGVIVRAWPDFWQHVPEFAAAARYVYEKYRLPPEFLCLSPADKTAAQSVCAALGEDIPSSISIYSRRTQHMSLLLSMRLHGLVFALRDKTPAAGVSYDPKVASFCREAGFPVLPLESITAKSLCRLMDEAAHLDGEALSASAERLRERERVNGVVAAELLAEWEQFLP